MYNTAWTGLREFHHIFSPIVSAPVFLEPVINMYMNPIAGSMAMYPMSLREFGLACLAIYAKVKRLPKQNIKKRANLVAIGVIC